MVCRELTKTHEEIRRGTLAELAGWAQGGVRGEITLVVAGAAGQAGEADLAGAADDVAVRVAAGASRKDAVAAVAAELGLRKNALYEAVVARARAGNPAPGGRQRGQGTADGQ